MRDEAPVAVGGLILGKYRVERVLGKGGMGIVVAARHIDLDELFAIKLMLPTYSESREATERFLREARAAAKLKGDHVARVQDVGRLPDGTSYMVMEYLVGTDLKDLIRKNGPLGPEDAVTYVLQACETLREAHSIGIVHRDIKPANVFLTQGPNGSPRVKVIDFGISKQTGPDAVGLTSTRSFGGSPLYMSPEQMRSTKYVDHRTDIWSMGIVLYELLTGTTPFHADTITAVAGRVLQDEPIPIYHIRHDIPTWIDAVVLRCLAKNPSERFQTVAELMEALRGANHAGLLGPVNAPGGTWPMTDKAAPLDQLTQSLSPATAPLPGSAERIGSGSTTANFAQSAGEARKPATQDSPPRRAAMWSGLVLGCLVCAGGAFVLFRTRSGPQGTGALPVASTGVETTQGSDTHPPVSAARSEAPEGEPPLTAPSPQPMGSMTTSSSSGGSQVRPPAVQALRPPAPGSTATATPSAASAATMPIASATSTAAAKPPVPNSPPSAPATQSGVRKSEPLY